MQKADLKNLSLPDCPGVYYFLNNQKGILYIGKATSLKNRVGSYFLPNLKEARSALILNMVEEAFTVEFTPTESVLEALILETNLIRTHKPKFNTKSKDDKSYNHLVITKEEWPRVLVVRGKDLTERFEPHEIQAHFGPFPSGSLLREALKIIRKLFKYYDTKEPIREKQTKLEKGKIDFNRQIGLYPGSGDIDEYKKTIRHIRLFFEGKKAKIISELEKEMHSAAKAHEFERANILKKKVFALQHIEDVALIKKDYSGTLDEGALRIEAYDIAHLGGKNMVGVMTVVIRGESRPSEYRKFKIKSLNDANDPAALAEVLRRRLAHPEWTFPQVIVVDGNEIQINAADKVLREFNLFIPVVAVVKNDKHKASRLIAPKSLAKNHLEILLANAESHRFAINYYRNLSRKRALL